MSASLRTVHLRITGQVQGVFFRAWAAAMAEKLQLDGWVRNRRDGSVEAVFQGPADKVAAMIAECGHGPCDAHVKAVEMLGEGGAAPSGFLIKPTA